MISTFFAEKSPPPHNVLRTLLHTALLTYTVEPVYSGHMRFLEKVSAITRCPLYGGFQYFAKKMEKKIR